MVLRALTKYKDHPSIKVINQNVALNGNAFSFSHVSPNEVMKQIDLLDKNKSNSWNISTGILKATRNILCPYLTDCIDSAVYDYNFPNELMEADLTPLLKNDDSNHKGNFRPISVLSAVSKIYEKLLKDQICPYFQVKLSEILCCFRERYSTQHALLRV